MSWRRSAGEPRQQLNWLMAGGAAALVSFIAAAVARRRRTAPGRWSATSLVIGIAALPAGMGVAILKYRLYEIDRIISRTLAYAIVTGLLVGVYAGLVLLARQVLSVDSPVAVAASTLAAAALVQPGCGDGCSGWWTAGSTGSGTTGSGRWRRSRPGSRTRWTST